MALPNSRDVTFAATDPVQAAVLNNLQDQIVACKHKEREYGVHPGAFTPSVGAPVFTGVEWGPVAAAAYTVYAGLFIPVGDRITHVTFRYNRFAGNILGYLVKLLTGVESTIASFTDNAGGVGVIHDLAGINHTVLAGYQYALKVQVDATAAAGGSNVIACTAFADNL